MLRAGCIPGLFRSRRNAIGSATKGGRAAAAATNPSSSPPRPYVHRPSIIASLHTLPRLASPRVCRPPSRMQPVSQSAGGEEGEQAINGTAPVITNDRHCPQAPSLERRGQPGDQPPLWRSNGMVDLWWVAVCGETAQALPAVHLTWAVLCLGGTAARLPPDSSEAAPFWDKAQPRVFSTLARRGNWLDNRGKSKQRRKGAGRQHNNKVKQRRKGIECALTRHGF